VTTLKRAVKNLLFGPLVPQSAWSLLHRLSLQGMNIGSAGHPSDSGELWVLDRMIAHASRADAPVVFDVGANVGDYAEEVCARARGNVALHCFEPSARVFAKLEARVGGKPGVTLHRAGLSDAPGEAVLHSSANEAESGMSSLYDRKLDHVGIHLGQTETIRLTTIDRFCEAQGVKHIHFMKLDCEGHELKVLSGGRRMLQSGAIDFVQFEFGGCNLDSRTYLKDFFDVLTPRYSLFRVLRRGVQPLPVYREQDEIFTTTNFLAARPEVVGVLG
jgi:FkbM family methyltransferase